MDTHTMLIYLIFLLLITGITMVILLIREGVSFWKILIFATSFYFLGEASMYIQKVM